MELNHFKVLNAIKSKTETKDNGFVKLKYISWATAWEEVKKIYPDANYEIERFENNLPYIYDEKTGYIVFTKVTIETITHQMWLPVMDGNNKAMKSEVYEYTTKNGKKTVQAATMFDINKTIMRCLTKNLAMFGFGISLYVGEDLPDSEKTKEKQVKMPERMTDEQEIWLKENGADFPKMIEYAKKNYKVDYITKEMANKKIEVLQKNKKPF